MLRSPFPVWLLRRAAAQRRLCSGRGGPGAGEGKGKPERPRWRSLAEELGTKDRSKTADELRALRGESGVTARRKTEREKRLGLKQANAACKADAPSAAENEEQGETQVRFMGGLFVTIALMSLGGTMLAVPLYKMYCSTSPQLAGGMTAQAKRRQDLEAIFEGDESNMPEVASLLRVVFRGALGSTEHNVKFVPLQKAMDVLIGEPALAFFNVYNATDKTLIGLSTYNVSPAEAAQYFNKIQCFCFEEQRIKPRELIEMPIFFFVDKEYLDDPATQTITSLLLSYTLFVV